MTRLWMTSARVAGLLLLALTSTATPAYTQSLFNAAGLGTPVDALDGRARALGSIGIGLTGGSMMQTAPGGLARLEISTGIMAASPSWIDYSASNSRSGTFKGNRFPLLGIAYPVLGGMAAIQISSVLDQTYEVTRIGETDLGDGPVRTSDAFTQDGSVSNVNLGFSRALRAPSAHIRTTSGDG